MAERVRYGTWDGGWSAKSPRWPVGWGLVGEECEVARGVGVGRRRVRDGPWGGGWSAKSARCTVEMGDGRRRVRGGPWGGGWGETSIVVRLCRMHPKVTTLHLGATSTTTKTFGIGRASVA